MSVFEATLDRRPWVWQVTSLSCLLGFLLAGSLMTVRNINRSGVGRSRTGVPPAANTASSASLQLLQKEIKALNEQKSKLETSLSTGKGELKTLNDELQKAKALAGLTEVKGPGIVITLTDSKKRPPSSRVYDYDKYLVHDIDLQQVVHELLASGAEAIAIKDQRIVARTAIRCVGPTIQVNSVAISPPYIITAIGDVGTLTGGLNLPMGVLESIRRYDPGMIKLESKKALAIPAYAGSTDLKYAKPATTKQKREGHE